MSEMKKHEMGQLDEGKLASEVAAEMPAVAVAKGPIPGERLPEDFVNPPAGSVGHYCTDPRGRYKPSWLCLKINKAHENMPQRQYFNHNGRQWLVEVGVWVDVPPQIITLLEYTEQEIISMDISKANLVVDRSVPMVIDTVPRFSTNMIASA